jgi:hypothetical protein
MCVHTRVQAAADASEEQIRGLVLLNTAGAMNNKGVVGDWRILAVYPLLLLIDFLLSIPAVRVACPLYDDAVLIKITRAAQATTHEHSQYITSRYICADWCTLHCIPRVDSSCLSQN